MKKAKRRTQVLYAMGILFGGMILGFGIASIVKTSPVSSIISGLEKNLVNSSKLRVHNIQNLVWVEGEVDSLDEQIRIKKICLALTKLYEKMSVRSLVVLSDGEKRDIANKVERLIGSPEITVRPLGGYLYIEGTAESDFEADRAVEYAKALGYHPSRIPNIEFGMNKRSPNGKKTYTAKDNYAFWPYAIVDILRVRRAPPKKPMK